MDKYQLISLTYPKLTFSAAPVDSLLTVDVIIGNQAFSRARSNIYPG